MGPRSRRKTAEKRPIVGHMFEQLALGRRRLAGKTKALMKLSPCFACSHLLSKRGGCALVLNFLALVC